MPKQKTHKGTAKRVRVTGTGKLVREHTNNQHKFEVQVLLAQAPGRAASACCPRPTPRA